MLLAMSGYRHEGATRSQIAQSRPPGSSQLLQTNSPGLQGPKAWSLTILTAEAAMMLHLLMVQDGVDISGMPALYLQMLQ